MWVSPPTVFFHQKKSCLCQHVLSASCKISIHNSIGRAPALLYDLMCCDKLICVREHVQRGFRCVDLAHNETESLLTVAKKAVRFRGLEAVTRLSTLSTAFGHIWPIFVSCGFVVIVLKFFLKLFGFLVGKCAGLCCILIRERVSETWNCKLVWGQRLSGDLMWERRLRMTLGQSRNGSEEPRDRLVDQIHLKRGHGESRAGSPPLLQSFFHLTIWVFIHRFPLTLIKADERETSDCHVSWLSTRLRLALHNQPQSYWEMFSVISIFLSLVSFPQLRKSCFLSWRADDDEST